MGYDILLLLLLSVDVLAVVAPSRNPVSGLESTHTLTQWEEIC